MMKIAVFLLSLLLLPEVTVATKFDGHDLQQVIWGVLHGSLGKEMDEVESCIDESEATMEVLDEAITDIEEGTEESVKRGIQLLGEVMHEAVQDLKDCKIAAEDLDTLVEMAETLEHPLSFLYHAGKNIIVNRVEIIDEVETSIDDWNAEPPAYYDFGFNVGEIMKLVILGEDGDMEIGVATEME